MKINKMDSDKLSDIFFNHKNKNNLNLPLHERGLQQFWYNKKGFPFTPYSDIQHIGFDPNPKTYQDVFIEQQKKIHEFFKTPGWLNLLINDKKR